ncbi:MAG: aminopeptidase P family protein [Emcibacter sp.]|nr:aminopeptidase P family protein [Emcibacter sp.]
MTVKKNQVDLKERDWRYNRIRKAMAKEDLDGILAFVPAWRREDVCYLTAAALESSFALAYLPISGEPAAFVGSLEDVVAVRNAGFVDDIRLTSLLGLEGVADRIKSDMAKGRIGIAGAEFLPHATWKHLESQLPGFKFKNATPMITSIRWVKSEWEVAQMRHTGTICDAAWAAFLEACQPGVTEFEIIAEVEARLRGMGAEDNFMLIASGGDEVMGMTPPSDRKLQIGDMVRTELTPQCRGYWMQICRTAVIGEPSAGQRESFELFDAATAAGIAAVKPGATMHDVAMAENDVFRERGFGQYCTSEYTRVRGHGLGLHLDEVPVLEGIDTILEENSVLVVHPNTFTPLAGYHVLGDPVVVTATGAEKLISTPRILDVVPV